MTLPQIVVHALVFSECPWPDDLATLPMIVTVSLICGTSYHGTLGVVDSEVLYFKHVHVYMYGVQHQVSA